MGGVDFLAGEAVNIGGAAGGENSRGNLVETFGPKMILFTTLWDPKIFT